MRKQPIPKREPDWTSPRKRPGEKGWFRQGRWMIERERCVLEQTAPEPPFSNFSSIREGVRLAMRQLDGITDEAQAILIEEWTALMGDEIACHTRPGNLRNGVLTVFVKGSVWYAELRRYSLPVIQKKLTSRLGHNVLKRVILRPDPEGA